MTNYSHKIHITFRRSVFHFSELRGDVLSWCGRSSYWTSEFPTNFVSIDVHTFKLLPRQIQCRRCANLTCKDQWASEEQILSVEIFCHAVYAIFN